MDEITIIVAVLVATWGGMTNVIKVVEIKNGIRNQVLDIGVEKLLLKSQKAMLLTHDYVPLAIGVFLFLAVFGAGLVAIPFVYWIKAPKTLTLPEAIVCFAAGGFAFFALIVDAVASISEAKKMRENINAMV